MHLSIAAILHQFRRQWRGICIIKRHLVKIIAPISECQDQFGIRLKNAVQFEYICRETLIIRALSRKEKDCLSP